MDTAEMRSQPRAAVDRVMLSGELDLAAVPAVRRRLLDGLERASGSLLVDLSEVTFMDSVGLGALLMAARRCHERGMHVVLTAVPRRIYRLLEITGLTWGVPGLRVEIAAPPAADWLN